MDKMSITVKGEALSAARQKAAHLDKDMTAYVKLAVEVANKLPRPILRLMDEVEKSDDPELQDAVGELLRKFAFEANGLLFTKLNSELSSDISPELNGETPLARRKA